MAARGCGGSRTAGAIYCTCNLSPFGSPIEDFLVDPPVVMDKNDNGLSSKGTSWLERDGVWHLLDIVGENYYPNVADFVEEVRHLGLSRKLSSKLDFSRITINSRILLLHRRAHIENAAEYKRENPCPRNITNHDQSRMCAGLWWEDVTDHEDVAESYEGRDVVRTMPSFTYNAKRRPDNVKPDYKLAIFASFPILALEVIRDPEGQLHEKNITKAKKARIDVNIVDE